MKSKGSFFGLAALLLLLLGSIPALADTTTVLNFDSINTGTPGSYVNVDATAYFAANGVTLSGVTAGTSVAIINNQNLYGGAALNPVSAPNLLMQINSNNPVSFTLTFTTALTSFGFTIPGDAAPSAFPMWSVQAFTSGNVLLNSASQPFFTCCHGPLTYTLSGPNIDHVLISSNNGNFAGFSGIPLDNLVLTAPDAAPVPEPASLLLLGTGLIGAASGLRKKLNR